MACSRNFTSVLTVLILAAVESVKLPSHWARCKNDTSLNDCLKISIQNAMRDLGKGNRTLGVQPLDPWKMKLFVYNHGSISTDLKLTARDVSVIGFKNAKVDYVRTNWETMDLQINTPKLVLFGKYGVEGRVVFVPIEGKGNFRITIDDLTSRMKFVFEKYNKKGKEFIRVKESTLVPDAKNISVRFDNLFNGNKDLGNRMNDLINRNWRFILNTLQPIGLKSMAAPVKIVVNELFSRVPASDFIIS
ncbi:protein takeout-like [Cimex lectularius]|uniref:Uncharacterized protein n=1 Tax=Cimex lectularius TaxID=79782 RepID=A0A8I6SKQ6_CIMLE|nr:protein takeout-like [Cimex lectularius]